MSRTDYMRAGAGAASNSARLPVAAIGSVGPTQLFGILGDGFPSRRSARRITITMASKIGTQMEWAGTSGSRTLAVVSDVWKIRAVEYAPAPVIEHPGEEE